MSRVPAYSVGIIYLEAINSIVKFEHRLRQIYLKVVYAIVSFDSAYLWY